MSVTQYYDSNGEIVYHDCDAEPPIITNADRIRAMTDEELSEKFMRYVDCKHCPLSRDEECQRTYIECKQCWLDWLKQEATDGIT